MGNSSNKDDQKKKCFGRKVFGGKCEEKKSTDEDLSVDEICSKAGVLNIKNQRSPGQTNNKDSEIEIIGIKTDQKRNLSDNSVVRKQENRDPLMISKLQIINNEEIKLSIKRKLEDDKPPLKTAVITSTTGYACNTHTKPKISNCKKYKVSKSTCSKQEEKEHITAKVGSHQRPDEFTEQIENKVRGFFFGFQDRQSPGIVYHRGSIIDTCPVLKKIHQRALSLRTHKCMFKDPTTKDKTTLTCGKGNNSNQTDFPREMVNVVSPQQENEKVKKGDDASRQKTIVRLSLLTVLDGSGYAKTLKEKIKREEPDLNQEEQRVKLMTICRQHIETFAGKYEQESGPLPIKQEKFSTSLYHFVSTFAKPLLFKKVLGQSKAQKSNTGTNSLKYIFDGHRGETPELSDIKIEIIQKHHQNKKMGESDKNEGKDSGKKIHSDEKKDDTENRKESYEYHENDGRDLSDDNACGDSPDQIKKKQVYAKTFFTSEDLTFQRDINPVGPFDRGTYYRTDGEVVVEKCKRGSRKELQNKPKKVKTRGVPNKHLRQTAMPVKEADSNEIEENSKNADREEIDYLFDNFESALFEHVDKVMNYADGSINFTEDKRHLTELPAQIIHGKKNDCDLLEAKYASKPNKRRQKEHKKKQQRPKRQTTIQFGLNANNSANDPNTSSTDEENVDCLPTISYHSHPLLEENQHDCFSPTITFSPNPLSDIRSCAI